jgi:hypothetical protein
MQSNNGNGGARFGHDASDNSNNGSGGKSSNRINMGELEPHRDEGGKKAGMAPSGRRGRTANDINRRGSRHQDADFSSLRSPLDIGRTSASSRSMTLVTILIVIVIGQIYVQHHRSTNQQWQQQSTSLLLNPSDWKLQRHQTATTNLTLRTLLTAGHP